MLKSKWHMATLVVVLGIVSLHYAAGMGYFGRHEGPGVITPQPIPFNVVEGRSSTQVDAMTRLGVDEVKQILFGDLHVHTTISSDAFLYSLPLLGGEGTHPQADACDFARFCAALDFWSINDHAESISPRQWQETIDSVRQCNAIGNEGNNPDVVAFLGWEWTQKGKTPDNHFGHRNVILRDLEDGQIPTRPISIRTADVYADGQPLGFIKRTGLSLTMRQSRYQDWVRKMAERSSVDPCPVDVPSPDLPGDCHEGAATPGDLFRKLDEWGHTSMVIPHGTAWGYSAPGAASWDNQMTGANFNPDHQPLIEIYSGHGNSEEYRDFRATAFTDQGIPYCPQPSDDYYPSCWRAGEIIRERCQAEGESAVECEPRAAATRQLYVDRGNAGYHVVGNIELEEWLDAGQCQDCFLPSLNLRPAMSVQYMMARRNFDDPVKPEHLGFGFIGSSDVHTARPGTGYKEYGRRPMTEAGGLQPGGSTTALGGPELPPRPFGYEVDTKNLSSIALQESERAASMLYTGGLVATHATGRSREEIWTALKSKEVYATSGPRILLWFNAVTQDGARTPMGSTLETTTTPTFEVRAIGSFKQKPGCPAYSKAALTSERLEHLCKGECYNPSDERKLITRLEIVRIQPQISVDEPVADLIEDVWRSFPCAPDPSGCTVTFSDEDFDTSKRDTLYYVRAIEEESLAVNGGGVRCEYDETGRCIKVNICHGGSNRTPYDDDCLAPVEERAWSSPIYVAYGGE